MKYDQIIIYYFSGTGNARNAAIWIEKIAKGKVVYVLLIPFIISILKYYGILDIAKQSKLFEQGWSLITTSILILFGFLSYRILHFLMKYKIVNRIITYSSLSKYKFWRRFKPPEY
jgi:hypothetical protein